MAYARVSNNSQKDDLKNQISFIRQHVNAKGVILDDTITEIGSGLDYNRKKKKMERTARKSNAERN